MYKHKIATRFTEPGQLSDRTKKRHHAMKQVANAHDAKWKQKPAELMKLPRWGAIAAIIPLFCLAAWAVSEVAVPNLVSLAQSGPALLTGLVVMVAISMRALDVTPLQGTRRVEVLFQRTAPWTVGETQMQCWERMRSKDVAASVECYPDTYSGRVISVLDVAEIVAGRATTLTNMADKDRICLTLDLTEVEIAGLRANTMKIEDEKPVVVTLGDRHGAILPDLIEKYGSFQDVEAKEQEAELEALEAQLTPEIPHETHTFTLDVQRLSKALPRNITSTGTGMYWVKSTPNKNDDTQDGAPAGQVITLITGGLGADAFIGGYVTNVTRTETLAIVSHTAGTITLEGDLTNWLDTDDLDIFDSWSTWAAALAQLFTDQGSAEFTAIQYVRGFAGTYDETINPSTSLNSSEASGYALVLEGDPTDDRSNIHIAPSTGRGVWGRPDFVLVRHLKTTTTDSNAIQSSVTDLLLVHDCVITAPATAMGVQSFAVGVNVEDCVIVAGTYGIEATSSTRSLSVRRCATSGNGAAGASYGVAAIASADCPVVVEGCTIANFASAGSAAIYTDDVSAPIIASNNTFFNCTAGLRVIRSQGVTSINNIFDTCTYNYYSNIWPDEAVEGSITETWMLRNNCYKAGYTGFAYNGAASKTHAEFIAFDFVDEDGDLVDKDPLLTLPGSGNFILQAGSPCIHAGHGSGVLYDVNNNPLDPYHPDIGAVSTGIGPNVVYGS